MPRMPCGYATHGHTQVLTLPKNPIQYPNYKEYLECEARIKNGQELTAKQKKKYGNLKWDPMHTKYKEGQEIPDSVDINDEGTYDDIATDPVAREKMNKYGLTFPDNQAPDDKVRIRVKQPNGEYITGACPVGDPGNWIVEDKLIEE